MDFGFTEDDDAIKALDITTPQSAAEEKLRRVMEATGHKYRSRANYIPDIAYEADVDQVERAFALVARMIARDGDWLNYLEDEIERHVR